VTESLDATALDQLFRSARTPNAWKPEPLSPEQWQCLYNLLKWGPTSANCCPARFLFVASDEAKARLAPCLSGSNRVKSLDAPAIVIIAEDLDFAAKLPELFPHNPGVASWFADPATAKATAARNTALQGAYLILAARALGLDAGPMSGFDQAAVDEAFLAGTTLRTNFICALGHGVDTPRPRLPRLTFEQACQVL